MTEYETGLQESSVRHATEYELLLLVQSVDVVTDFCERLAPAADIHDIKAMRGMAESEIILRRQETVSRGCATGRQGQSRQGRTGMTDASTTGASTTGASTPEPSGHGVLAQLPAGLRIALADLRADAADALADPDGDDAATQAALAEMRADLATVRAAFAERMLARRAALRASRS